MRCRLHIRATLNYFLPNRAEGVINRLVGLKIQQQQQPGEKRQLVLVSIKKKERKKMGEVTRVKGGRGYFRSDVLRMT